MMDILEVVICKLITVESDIKHSVLGSIGKRLLTTF